MVAQEVPELICYHEHTKPICMYRAIPPKELRAD